MESSSEPNSSSFIPMSTAFNPTTELIKQAEKTARAGDLTHLAEHLSCGGSIVESSVERAITEGSYDLLELYLSFGFDPNAATVFGTMLCNAAWAKNPKLITLLLDYGADPNAPVRAYDALATAAMRGNVEIAKRLVERGAKVKGNGVLVAAAENHQVEMVLYLLSFGADVEELGMYCENLRLDEDMCTPLHKAVQEHQVAIMEILLDAGANCEALDAKNRSCIQVAEEEGTEEIVRILMAARETVRVLL